MKLQVFWDMTVLTKWLPLFQRGLLVPCSGCKQSFLGLLRHYRWRQQISHRCNLPMTLHHTPEDLYLYLHRKSRHNHHFRETCSIQSSMSKQSVGLLGSPLCSKCGVREETSAHILCECESLASLWHAYLGSFFFEPEDIRSLGLGAICNYGKVTGLSWFDMGTNGPSNESLGASELRGPKPKWKSINQSINAS